MKQFNLEEYLRLKEEGKEPKIVTRDGKSVRIICTERKTDCKHPIVALIDYGRYEQVNTYSIDGFLQYLNADHRDDLFFAPTKHEGWMNIYPWSGKRIKYAGDIYETENEALKDRSNKFIATIKIEWTE